MFSSPLLSLILMEGDRVREELGMCLVSVQGQSTVKKTFEYSFSWLKTTLGERQFIS